MAEPELVSLITGGLCRRCHGVSDRIRLGTKGPWCLFPVAVANKWIEENYEKNGAVCVPGCEGKVDLDMEDIPFPENYAGPIYR